MKRTTQYIVMTIYIIVGCGLAATKTISGRLMEGASNTWIGGKDAYVIALADESDAPDGIRVLGYAHPDVVGRWSISGLPASGAIHLAGFSANLRASLYYGQIELSSSSNLGILQTSYSIPVGIAGQLDSAIVRLLTNVPRLLMDKSNYENATGLLRIVQAYEAGGDSSERTLLFSDDYSGGLERWQAAGGRWTIEDGCLHAFYTHSCGSPGCPQGDLYLRDIEISQQDNWRMEVEFAYSQYPGSDYYYAPAAFILWQDSERKEQYAIGSGGQNWDGANQSEIGCSRQTWNDRWSSDPASRTVSVRWNPKHVNTFTLEKRGSSYSLLLNGEELMSFSGTSLTGKYHPGLHAYGNYIYDNFRIYRLR